MPPTPTPFTPRETLLRLGLTSLLFAALAAVCAPLTQAQADIGIGVFAWERSIRFAAPAALPYLAIFVLVAGSCLARRTPDAYNGHVAALLANLALAVACQVLVPLNFSVEPALLGLAGLPFDRAPSLHVGVVMVLWVRRAARRRG
jgi:hypothetical protein